MSSIGTLANQQNSPRLRQRNLMPYGNNICCRAAQSPGKEERGRRSLVNSSRVNLTGKPLPCDTSTPMCTEGDSRSFIIPEPYRKNTRMSTRASCPPRPRKSPISVVIAPIAPPRFRKQTANKVQTRKPENAVSAASTIPLNTANTCTQAADALRARRSTHRPRRRSSC